MVGQMLRKVTGKEADCSQSPDEAVATARFIRRHVDAGGISGKTACELINVNSHSLGVVGVHARTRQKVNVILIPKNTALPCRAVRAFKTARADQRSVKVSVVEGESDRPEHASPWASALSATCRRDCPPIRPSKWNMPITPTAESPWPRVPSVRYSQHVDIQRDVTRNLGDLDAWRARLCGQIEVPAENGAQDHPTDTSGRATRLKRLDTLYLGLGQLAARLALPEALARSQHGAAAAAAEELARAQAKVQRPSAAAGRSGPRRNDSVGRTAGPSQQRTPPDAGGSDFAYLVLGRECVTAGFEPPQAAKFLAEVRRLRQ